jgi:hypothetical protein
MVKNGQNRKEDKGERRPIPPTAGEAGKDRASRPRCSRVGYKGFFQRQMQKAASGERMARFPEPFILEIPATLLGDPVRFIG